MGQNQKKIFSIIVLSFSCLTIAAPAMANPVGGSEYLLIASFSFVIMLIVTYLLAFALEGFTFIFLWKNFIKKPFVAAAKIHLISVPIFIFTLCAILPISILINKEDNPYLNKLIAWIFIIIAEIFIVWLEYRLYNRLFKKSPDKFVITPLSNKKLLLSVFFANFFSFVVGSSIIYLLSSR